jgi:hypothetical protein
MELIVSSLVGAVLAFFGHLGANLASRAAGGRPSNARNRPALSSFPLQSEAKWAKGRDWWTKQMPAPQSKGPRASAGPAVVAEERPRVA